MSYSAFWSWARGLRILEVFIFLELSDTSLVELIISFVVDQAGKEILEKVVFIFRLRMISFEFTATALL